MNRRERGRRGSLANAALAAVFISALTVGSGCVRTPEAPSHPRLQTPIHRLSADGVTLQVSTQAQLLQRALAADVVYLGEKHDNMAQHRLQSWLLRSLVDAGARPALGLEAAAVEQTALLMEFTQANPQHAHSQMLETRLRMGLGWGAEQDERWRLYGQLLRTARAHQLETFGIDLPMALRRRLVKVGRAELSALETRGLASVAPAADTYRLQMLERLKAAHCGHGGAAYLQRLFETWELRNETMARAILTMLAADRVGPVVIVVGAGHVGDERALVRRVKNARPDVNQLALGFVEVGQGEGRVAEQMSDSGMAYDFIWFTPKMGVSMHEACEQFARAMAKVGREDSGNMD
ncbi:MAG: ChaN family lipoprotein [Gammaproteobacteria bacterium]|nr:ChaN family lipoprotein [Gammaproteobacteria bacterium]